MATRTKLPVATLDDVRATARLFNATLDETFTSGVCVDTNAGYQWSETESHAMVSDRGPVAYAELVARMVDSGIEFCTAGATCDHCHPVDDDTPDAPTTPKSDDTPTNMPNGDATMPTPTMDEIGDARTPTNGELVREIVVNGSSGWNVTDMDHATTLAALATEFTHVTWLPVDKGPHVYPRYTIVCAPVVGAEVSQGFNGDVYPCGTIESVTAKWTVRTSSGVVFRRRRETASWVATGGTWYMVAGNVAQWSREF